MPYGISGSAIPAGGALAAVRASATRRQIVKVLAAPTNDSSIMPPIEWQIILFASHIPVQNSMVRRNRTPSKRSIPHMAITVATIGKSPAGDFIVK